MANKRIQSIISLNSPVILGLFFICSILLALNYLSGGMINRWLACYRTSWTDPFQFPRLFTHVLVHQNFSHLTNNFLLILAVGPMVEEKYGSKNMAVMFLLTAAITGIIHVLLYRGVMLVGASALVFTLILLASFTNIREGRLPLTVLLVGLLYIGAEIVRGLSLSDNISHLSHVAGGVCGAGFGFFHHGDKIRKR